MKKIILGLYTLAFLTTGINANAQIKESTGEPVYFIDYRIRYVENDTTLSEEGKELIDTIFRRIIIKDNDTLSFFKRREIVLNSFTTAKERERNRLIGIQRCFAILDYVEQKYGVRRSKFLIRDFDPKVNDASEVQLVFPPPPGPRTSQKK